MPEEPKQQWWQRQTPTVKNITIWLSCFAAFIAVWGTLRALGVDALDFTIGCSSYSSQTESNTRGIDTLRRQMKHRKQFDSSQSLLNDSIRRGLYNKQRHK